MDAIHSLSPVMLCTGSKAHPAGQQNQAQYDQMDTQDKQPTELPTGFVTAGQALASAFDQLQKEWAEAAKAREGAE